MFNIYSPNCDSIIIVNPRNVAVTEEDEFTAPPSHSETETEQSIQYLAKWIENNSNERLKSNGLVNRQPTASNVEVDDQRQQKCMCCYYSCGCCIFEGLGKCCLGACIYGCYYGTLRCCCDCCGCLEMILTVKEVNSDKSCPYLNYEEAAGIIFVPCHMCRGIDTDEF